MADAVVVGLIGGAGIALGALLTWLTATRDLGLRRRMQATDAFMRVAARAHGYPEGRDDEHMGLSEQLAAIYLLAELGRTYRWLRPATRAFLDDEARWLKVHENPLAPNLLAAVVAARKIVPD